MKTLHTADFVVTLDAGNTVIPDGRTTPVSVALAASAAMMTGLAASAAATTASPAKAAAPTAQAAAACRHHHAIAYVINGGSDTVTPIRTATNNLGRRLKSAMTHRHRDRTATAGP
jgi:hypothetical protein